MTLSFPELNSFNSDQKSNHVYLIDTRLTHTSLLCAGSASKLPLRARHFSEVPNLSIAFNLPAGWGCLAFSQILTSGQPGTKLWLNILWD